ncbi:LOW QUALITY PROTEIN: EEF1A lysine methyltransferase 2-like [Artemia franciscana]|uniref:LOW QUALITY PROTEIN: EEF1A lysine methyltransferase 2-like n=1 Tax=Artemia franciscana TaxID=6661 RepID=UPI0032DABB70
MSQTADLEPSALGKKEFWDDQYQLELENFHDHGDEGEVWFGNLVMNRIVKWCSSSESIDKKTPVLDVGSGNGLLALEISRKGFLNVLGIDYSETAVQLSREIAKESSSHVRLKFAIFCRNLAAFSKGSKFGLILDKGTYDAISLSDNAVEDRGKYVENIHSIMLPNSFFLIATCNWTMEEIVQSFLPYFCFVETIPTPSFQFGGKQGNNVSIVVFKRN